MSGASIGRRAFAVAGCRCEARRTPSPCLLRFHTARCPSQSVNHCTRRTSARPPKRNARKQLFDQQASDVLVHPAPIPTFSLFPEARSRFNVRLTRNPPVLSFRLNRLGQGRRSWRPAASAPAPQPLCRMEWLHCALSPNLESVQSAGETSEPTPVPHDRHMELRGVCF